MQPIIEMLCHQVRMEQEEAIYKAVVDYGISVDKERLTKALCDAKSFYDEGYAEGKRCAVRHGRWEERPVNIGTPTTDLFCSLCNFPAWNRKYTYCPNCGARMDLEVSE
jgi:hypothetical protein